VAEIEEKIKLAGDKIRQSRYTTAYTGAGISVESGIPPFRGDEGIWSKYDPQILDLGYFKQHPKKSWVVIREIFYDFFGKAKPNPAHLTLARMEREGYLGRTITQNIDNLHQEAGSRMVFEFHGNSKTLICITCHRKYHVNGQNLTILPPTCQECGGILKPDFIFFGENIPRKALLAAHEAAQISDIFLVIGTAGEVVPANHFPFLAKANGATIIEINTHPSAYTDQITDLFIQGKAGKVMALLEDNLFSTPLNND
jgi:NAD-dependent deacetylase